MHKYRIKELILNAFNSVTRIKRISLGIITQGRKIRLPSLFSPLYMEYINASQMIFS